MRSPQLSPGASAPDLAPGESHLPAALLDELHKLQRALNHGAIVDLRNATHGERAELLNALAARLSAVSHMCAHAGGAVRYGR